MIRFLLLIAVIYFLLFAQNILAGEMVANSILDFSDIQGQNNWYYGYYTYPFDTNSFHLMQDYSEVDKAWYVKKGRYWTNLTSDCGHPNGKITGGNREPVEQWAVRRWISSVDGKILIFGLVKKNGITAGDGTDCLILVDGKEVWNYTLDYDDYRGYNYVLTLDVTIGAKIDFVIAPKDNDYYDSTYFSAIIVTDDEHCGDFEAGKQYCINNPNACGLYSSCDCGENVVRNMCATFDFFTNTLHIPCLDLGISYWLDLKLINTEPVQLELTDFGKINSSVVPTR